MKSNLVLKIFDLVGRPGSILEEVKYLIKERELKENIESTMYPLLSAYMFDLMKLSTYTARNLLL